MTIWHCKLKGGPFHDEEASIDKLPARIYVTPCPNCGSHWYGSPEGEPYTLDEVFDDSRATYVHGDLIGSDGPSTREHTPIKHHERDKELQPA